MTLSESCSFYFPRGIRALRSKTDTTYVTRAEKHDEFASQFRRLMDVNVLGNVFLYTAFMPQILKGKVKKVVVISSGHADTDIVSKYDIDLAPLYATSKAAMNMITAKFSAQYKQDGVLFLSMSPGTVDTGGLSNCKNFPPMLPFALENRLS
jgi:NAD(P)-dependent dehydrogenase (short-subunit alcohol dehydrogenase family)